MKTHIEKGNKKCCKMLELVITQSVSTANGKYAREIKCITSGSGIPSLLDSVFSIPCELFKSRSNVRTYFRGEDVDNDQYGHKQIVNLTEPLQLSEGALNLWLGERNLKMLEREGGKERIF